MNDIKKRGVFGLPGWVFLVLGAVLFLFSNGRWAVAPLAWIAPVPLLVSLRGRKSAWTTMALLPFFILAAGVMLRGIIPGWLGLLTLALTAYFGLLWWLPYAIDGLFFNRVPEGLRLWIFPAALTVVEYLSTLVFGDWGSVAFSQTESLELLQVASLTGVWGITFLIGWFGSLAAGVIREGWTQRSSRKTVAVFAAAVAVVALYGSARLRFSVPAGPTVRIGSFTAHQGEEGIAGLHGLIAESRRTAAAGARVVFWPEGLIDVTAAEAAVIEREVARLARELGIYLMPSFHRRPEEGAAGSNRTLLFGPDGHRLWDYIKSYPVPGSPDARGDGRVPIVEAPFGRIGAAICYDFDFPQFIRQAGRKRVGVMLDPSWDWRAIDPLHTRMAMVRAVENGFSLVRHTVEGLSLAVDPLGRTRAALDHFRTADRLFIADVPRRGMRTVYAWAGDWLPWACLLALLAAAGFAVLRKPR